jgi:hypothetical protein
LSAAQIARDTGLSPRGARVVLEGLLAQRIVAVFGQSRAQVYALETSHPMASSLVTLFQSERDRWPKV